jgi:hypothetical protein
VFWGCGCSAIATEEPSRVLGECRPCDAGDDVDPELESGGASANTQSAQLITKEVAHVLAKASPELARIEEEQDRKDALGDWTSGSGIHTVPHCLTSARTEGEATRARSRSVSAAATRAPHGVRR